MAAKKKKTTIKSKAKKTAKANKPLAQVTHYYDKINVAVLKLKSPLKVGDYIEFKKGNESFSQIIESMQVNHKQIQGARVGSEIGLKVIKKVDDTWQVFKAHAPKLEFRPPSVSELPSFLQKPIFPPMVSKQMNDRINNKPAQQQQAPQVQQSPKPSAKSDKKTGYGDIKFFKF